MSLELGQQLLVDFAIGLVGSVCCRWNWARVVGCLLIPFGVSFIALGPKNFSGSMADGGGLVYTFFLYVAFNGLLASGLGGFLGYLARRGLKLKIV